jgi:hypothetical protein
MYKSWMWKQRSYREQFQGDEGNGGAGGTAEAQQQVDEQAQDDEQTTGETPEDEQTTGAADDQTSDDGVIVTIGDETPPAANDDEIDGRPAPDWVKNLRKENRELKKREREWERERQAAQQATAPKVEDAGAEPTLEDDDVAFDPEVFKQKWTAWNERKRKADEMAAKQREEQEAAATSWQKKLDAYKAAGAALKVEDFDGAEHVIRETMSPTQQAVIVSGADKPELVVYALGRNPAKAKELAGIKDPVKFAFAVAKLEAQLKVTPRNTPPAPERQVRGTAGGATPVDNVLARLEADADRTGDRSKVIAYKREQRNKAAA